MEDTLEVLFTNSQVFEERMYVRVCVCTRVHNVYWSTYLFYKILVMLNLLCVYVLGERMLKHFSVMGKFLYFYAWLL